MKKKWDYYSKIIQLLEKEKRKETWKKILESSNFHSQVKNCRDIDDGNLCIGKKLSR